MNTIPARDWNRMIDDLARNQILGATVLSGGKWRHPWSVEVGWNASRERFEASIKPGFVNGLDPELRVNGEDAPDATLKRLGQTSISARSKYVDALLTESPLLPLTQWRAIGFDAPSGADGEAIPPYLIGQGASPPTNGAPATGFERLLRATEIVLFKDRINTTTQWTFGQGTDNTAAQFDVAYTLKPGARQRAYIRTERKTSLPAALDPVLRLLGEWQDNGTDRLPVATVFLLSPPGTAKQSEPDSAWTPYVQHHLFWNLVHDVNVSPRPVVSDGLGIPRGLGLGVADVTISNLAARINDQNDALTEFLNNNVAEGRFWSV
ncbi:hypothetical protein EBZ39_02945 [bacterium]|nr:hypothetical protein [bacterium]